MDKKFLDKDTLFERINYCFRDLAAVDASIQQRAAKALAMDLREAQYAFDKLKNNKRVKVGNGYGLNACAPSVIYALRMFIRGLCRDCASQGLVLGLRTIVAAVPAIDLMLLVKLIDKFQGSNSSIKGQEERNCLLDQLFAYEVFRDQANLQKNVDQIMTLLQSRNLPNVL